MSISRQQKWVLAREELKPRKATLNRPASESKQNGVSLAGGQRMAKIVSIRYHCPIYCIFKLNKNACSTLSRHIWLFDKGYYQSLKHKARNTNSNVMKHNINTYAANTTTNITEMTKKYNPNKAVKVRPSDPSWLTTHIKKIIRKRKRLFDKFKKNNKE